MTMLPSEVMDVLISLVVVIISQNIHTSEQSCIAYIHLFVNYTSIMMRKMMKKRKHTQSI